MRTGQHGEAAEVQRGPGRLSGTARPKAQAGAVQRTQDSVLSFTGAPWDTCGALCGFARVAPRSSSAGAGDSYEMAALEAETRPWGRSLTDTGPARPLIRMTGRSA